MADHHLPHKVDNDYVEHEKSYDLFLAAMKWGTIGSLIMLLIVGSWTLLLPWALTLFLIILLLAASTIV